jgi:hypothetical protein
MILNIIDYGAKPNGELCTEQIQRAIDDCFLQGGGEVVIPSGEFVIGGLRLRSNVTLHLLENAILKGSIDPEEYCTYLQDKIEPISKAEIESFVPTFNLVEGVTVCRSAYPYSRWNNAMIRAINAKNIAIIGEKGSKIDGQNCYDPLGEENYRGPHAINMWFCENITLRGYTIQDSANWAHAIHNSKNIMAKNLTVLAGHDGFDVRTCDDILVEDCRFLTGDDCIAGFDNIAVVIRNCYFESACSMLRFGGTDVLVENCQGKAPATYGFRGFLSMEDKKNRSNHTENCRHSCHNVFLYYCDNRAKIRNAPGNIVIKNSNFTGTDSVMRLPFGHVWCCNRSLDDITFENCVIEGVYIPMQFQCPANEPLTLTMKNCKITPREGWQDMHFIEGENVEKIHLQKVDMTAFKNPRILCNPQPEIIIE